MARKKADVGDIEQVKEKKTKAQLEKERQVEELRYILSTSGGRNWIWRLLSECKIYKAKVTDQLLTFREIGREDIGLWILAEIMETEPYAYIKMQEEAKEREIN